MGREPASPSEYGAVRVSCWSIGRPDADDGGTSCVCDAGLAYATDVVCSNALLDINCSTTFGFSGSPQCGEYGHVVYCSSALLGLVGCNVDPAKTVRVMQRCK
jgi:hypothetical protein